MRERGCCDFRTHRESARVEARRALNESSTSTQFTRAAFIPALRFAQGTRFPHIVLLRAGGGDSQRQRRERSDGRNRLPHRRRRRRRQDTLFEVLSPRNLTRRFESAVAYLEAAPSRQATAGATALTLGFFAATTSITIIGEAQDWDSLAGAVLLLITETISKAFYTSRRRRGMLEWKLLNAFKVGVTYGMIIDALRNAVKF